MRYQKIGKWAVTVGMVGWILAFSWANCEGQKIGDYIDALPALTGASGDEELMVKEDTATNDMKSLSLTNLKTQGKIMDLDAITAKGDILVGTGADAVTVLSVGANGEIIIADSAEATGWKWGTSVSQVNVSKNSGATVGTRATLNFIEGTNVTLTIADDAGGDEVDITINATGGGSSIVLDLTDDDVDESTALGEVATTGDTNSIFTEPSADKLLIDVSNNWPTADTANAGDSATAFFSTGEVEDARVVNALTIAGGTIGTSAITLVQSAAPTPTAEGVIEWETDDEHIIIGDGTDQVEFVPTEDVSGDATMDTAGALTIAANAVALTTDTTGNYVASITNGSGITGGDGGSEGAALTLAATLGTSVDASEIDADAVGTSELDDDANSPTAGDIVIVETGAASFDYITPNAGTDVTADLEEETHGTEHDGTDGDYVKDAGDTMTGDLDVDAEMAVGNRDTPSSLTYYNDTLTGNAPMIVSQTENSAGTESRAAMHVHLFADPTANTSGTRQGSFTTLETLTASTEDFTGSVRGSFAAVDHTSSGTLTNATGVEGILDVLATGNVTAGQGGHFVVRADTGSNMTITNARGVIGQVEIQSATGTITNGEAFRVNIVNPAGGTLTNAYGFRLTDGGITGTNQWGISIEDADPANFFAGDVRIGYSPDITESTAFQVAGANTYGNSIFAAGTTPFPVLNFFGARGSIGSETATQANDNIGFIGGRGHDGTNWNTGSKATIQFFANEINTATNQGTRIEFSTTPDASTTRALALTIEEDGDLSLEGNNINTGGTTLATAELDLLDGMTAKTGLDTKFVTGTEGTSGNCAEWNVDGDLVDAGAACGGGGGGEWTDTGTIIHPNEETVDEIAIGGTTEAGADIFLGVDGAAVFNEQGAAVDLRVEGDTVTNLFVVDGSDDDIDIAGPLNTTSYMDLTETTVGTPAANVLRIGAVDNAGTTEFNIKDSNGLAARLIPGDGLLNLESVTAHKNATCDEEQYHFIDNNNGFWQFNLPAGCAVGKKFFIYHVGDEWDTGLIEVRNNAGSRLQYLSNGNHTDLIWDGTNWIDLYSLDGDGGLYDDYGNTTVLGTAARAQAGGGTAIGGSANGDALGTAIGISARAIDENLALGQNADADAHEFAVAIGYDTHALRIAEFTTSMDTVGSDSTGSHHGTWTWSDDAFAAVAVPALTEIFNGDVNNARNTIPADSASYFELKCVMRDTNDRKAWYYSEGGISRDGSNNTAIDWGGTVTVKHEDVAAWDLAVTADDTNESLKIEFMGNDSDTDNFTIRIACAADFEEVRGD